MSVAYEMVATRQILGRQLLWAKTILGEPASKSNSRKLVLIRKSPRFIKSKKALSYEQMFAGQIQKPLHPIECELAIVVRVFYATRRPDLDISLIQDCLQRCGVIRNDRAIREIHAYGDLDRINPRAEIELWSLA